MNSKLFTNRHIAEYSDEELLLQKNQYSIPIKRTMHSIINSLLELKAKDIYIHSILAGNGFYRYFNPSNSYPLATCQSISSPLFFDNTDTHFHLSIDFTEFEIRQRILKGERNHG